MLGGDVPNLPTGTTNTVLLVVASTLVAGKDVFQVGKMRGKVSSLQKNVWKEFLVLNGNTLITMVHIRPFVQVSLIFVSIIFPSDHYIA